MVNIITQFTRRDHKLTACTLGTSDLISVTFVGCRLLPSSQINSLHSGYIWPNISNMCRLQALTLITKPLIWWVLAVWNSIMPSEDGAVHSLLQFECSLTFWHVGTCHWERCSVLTRSMARTCSFTTTHHLPITEWAVTLHKYGAQRDR